MECRYKYPHAAITADCVIYGFDGERLKILLPPPLAFDHNEIIAEAHRYLEELIRLKPVAFELLNKTFSLGELQRVYEEITGKNYDRRNFRRKAMQSGLLARVDMQRSHLDSPDTNCAASIPTDVIGQPMRSRPGRKPNRLFTFLSNRSKKDEEESSDNADASIRDLFDF